LVYGVKATRFHRGAFTLIELLVVVSIILLLIGIMVPSLSRARTSARGVVCLSNLHSIGQAIRGYLGENHDYYPPMSLFPTAELALHPQNPRPAMAEILAPYIGNQSQVFKCPADRIENTESLNSFLGLTFASEGVTGLDTPPPGIVTWFEWQKSSYGPIPGLTVVSADGRWLLSQENRDNLNLTEIFGSASRIPLLGDYEPFHPKLSDSSSAGHMILYADFHEEAGK
jgi:prepilin-type N-terminal cleavage/methylation domain-containing protein